MLYLKVTARDGAIYYLKRMGQLPKKMQEVIMDCSMGVGNVSHVYSAVLEAFASKISSTAFQALPWPVKRDFMMEAVRLWKNDWVAQMSGEEPDLVY